MFRPDPLRTPLLGAPGLRLSFALPSDPADRSFGARGLRAPQELSGRIASLWARRPRARRLLLPDEEAASTRRARRSEAAIKAILARSRPRFRRLEEAPHGRFALLKLLATGAALRLWLMLSYRPGFVGYPDARAYIIAARGPLYWNPYKPVGYPLFLRALRALDSRLSVTVMAQHLLGLATGALIYFATAPFVRRAALALLPAAVVLFGGSQVFLEHAVLSDAPYTFLLGIVLYCAVRSLTSRARFAWLAGAGAALAASVTLRTVGLFLVPVVAAWAVAAAGLWHAAHPYLAVLAPVVVLLLAYAIPQHAVTARWALTRSTSFAFYSRVAPIADCTRFAPPPGTAGLCEQSDARTRPNANWYIFNLDAPAIRLYGVPPWPLTRVTPAEYQWPGDEPTGRFARAVLVHQPLDYLATLLEGLANYVAPRTGRPSVFEYDQEMLIRELHNQHYEREAIPDITSYYSTGAGYLRRGVGALDAYGRMAKTEGPLTAVLAALMLAGWALSRGHAHSAASLFASTSISLAVLPVAILFYDVRYAAPMAMPLTAAAAIGIDRLWDIMGRSGARDQ